MRTPKVVVCDVDGTLVAYHQSLTERTRRVILCLKEHGIYFGIASGRPLDEITPLTNEWQVSEDMVMGMNGNQLYDAIDDKEYSYFMMEPEWIKETLEIMKPYDTNPMVSLHGKDYTKKLDAITEMHSKYIGKEAVICSEDLHELYQEPNYKIMFRIAPEQMPEIEEYVKKFDNDRFRAFKTGAAMIEFQSSKGNKGYALKEFCKYHNIDIEDSMAFGDTSNDNELLLAAGWGVCLLNGTDDTKACANEITELPVQEDGFADYIEKNILIPNGWM